MPDQVTQSQVVAAGRAAHIPEEDLAYWLAIVQDESGGHFDPEATPTSTGEPGGVGPAQKVGFPLPASGEDLSAWAQRNLLAGAQEFASDIRSWPKNIQNAIGSYYAGVGGVTEHGLSKTFPSSPPSIYQYVANIDKIAAGVPGSLSYPAGGPNSVVPSIIPTSPAGSPGAPAEASPSNIFKEAGIRFLQLVIGLVLIFIAVRSIVSNVNESQRAQKAANTRKAMRRK